MQHCLKQSNVSQHHSAISSWCTTCQRCQITKQMRNDKTVNQLSACNHDTNVTLHIKAKKSRSTIQLILMKIINHKTIRCEIWFGIKWTVNLFAPITNEASTPTTYTSTVPTGPLLTNPTLVPRYVGLTIWHLTVATQCFISGLGGCWNWQL